MNRRQLEHALRASGSLSGCRELIVIGSQALLASFPDAPEELLRSMEVDLYPHEFPERADLIDGSIGELSPFHDAFGFYVHGVGPETAILPSRWNERLVRLEGEETGGIVGWCLAPVDLAVSKLAAGRPKDLEFVRALFRHELLDPTAVTTILTELAPEMRDLVGGRLRECTAER